MAVKRKTRDERPMKKLGKLERRKIESKFSKVGYSKNSYLGPLIEKYGSLKVIFDD